MCLNRKGDSRYTSKSDAASTGKWSGKAALFVNSDEGQSCRKTSVSGSIVAISFAFRETHKGCLASLDQDDPVLF